MIKKIIEESFLDGVEAKVINDGGLAPIEPFENTPTIKQEDIDFVTNTFTTMTMRDIFSKERNEVRMMVDKVVEDMKGLGYDSDKELNITEEDLDGLMREIYGKE